MKGKDKRLTVALKALWLYSTLLWAYIAVENLAYPAAVYSTNFSAYVPIKTNLLGIIFFALSFVFYVMWKLQASR